MAFREHLEEVCRTEGAVAASVIGYDGIPVETVLASETDVDLESWLVELSGMLKELRDAAGRLDTGAVGEVSIGTERLVAILRPLNPEFFVVLAMRPEGNYGKGRYLLRMAAPRLQGEF
jgi:predicted regulator of Ras-like GTPase activity (Roadblock/LC7/MglB family)